MEGKASLSERREGVLVAAHGKPGSLEKEGLRGAGRRRAARPAAARVVFGVAMMVVRRRVAVAVGAVGRQSGCRIGARLADLLGLHAVEEEAPLGRDVQPQDQERRDSIHLIESRGPPGPPQDLFFDRE
jgi:hypothetical protein